MGVLNVTPDSFSDGGRYLNLDAALAHAHKLCEEGADIIDVGGESSRPGAEPVPVEVEQERVIPVIHALHRSVPAALSIDTTKPEVAQAALDAGAHIINDISAGSEGAALFELAKQFEAGLVLMHMKGSPRTMQVEPTYKDVVREVAQFLNERAALAVHHGVAASHIALDPGIGFGKTFDHNWKLIHHLDSLTSGDHPVLVGLSRKRFLGALCGREVNERLPAGLAAQTVAILRGAAIIRTHDVKGSCDAARVADRIIAEDKKNDAMDGAMAFA